MRRCPSGLARWQPTGGTERGAQGPWTLVLLDVAVVENVALDTAGDAATGGVPFLPGVVNVEIAVEVAGNPDERSGLCGG